VNLIDRYILRSVLGTCAGAVGLFAFVLVLGNAIRDLLSYVLAGQLGLGAFARLVAMLVPFVISYALPMGMLTGVLLTLGRLSADSEITALRAAGIGLTRLARPVLLLGAAGLALALYVNFDAMPRARVQYHRELAEAVRTNPLSFIVPKTFVRDFSGYVIYLGEKNGTTLKDFWLWRLDDQKRVTQVVHAQSGRIDYDEATNELIVTLTQAHAETRDPKNPENFSLAQPVLSFRQSEPIRISLDRVFGRPAERRKLDWMTYAELQREQARVESLRPQAADPKEQARQELRVRMTVQDKFTTALSVFSFALIAVPLGIKVSRRETSANLGLALLLVLGYYFLTVMVKWLDRHPEYRPELLLWVPNLVFLGLAVWLFRRTENQQ
jgi:lipopolysaccharide export system permease protein